MPKKNTLRHSLNEILNNPLCRGAQIVNGIITFLIIFSIAIIPLHFFTTNISEETLFLIEKITVSIFTIEYGLRIWADKKPWRYIFSWWGLVDLAAILPFYLELGGLIENSYIFLILRLLRTLKLVKIYEIKRNTEAEVATTSHGKFNVIEGEHIERIVQKHPVVFLISLTMPLMFTTTGLIILAFAGSNTIGIAFAVLFFTFAILFFFKAWLDFNYDAIYVTNKRIILQRRELFGVDMNHISYEAITNIKPNNTGILHFFLGSGHVHIETAASGGNKDFTYLKKPHTVVEHITNNRQKILSGKKVLPLDTAKPMEE